MTKITFPRDLLIEELKDLYSAESQLIKALPKMAKAASSKALRDAFDTHLGQTRGHAERLEKIGKQLGESMTGKKCKAMEGLIAEGKEIIEEDAEPAMHDLAQRPRHRLPRCADELAVGEKSGSDLLQPQPGMADRARHHVAEHGQREPRQT